jgi:hypothetical protein
MTVNIRQSFLQDAEKGCLSSAGKSMHVFGEIKHGRNSASLTKSLYVPFGG